MLRSDTAQVERWRRLRAQIATSDGPDRDALLRQQSREVRQSIARMIDRAGLGHIGGDFSVTDILVALYWHTLRIDPANPDLPERDRFILSKGHCAAALYSVLALSGYFPTSELSGFMAPLSPLSGHPNRNKVPGVETNTGPLGHGLPVAVGEAIGLRRRPDGFRVFVVLGDGELQEGSNWEALMFAAQQRLGNLTAIIDRNGLQQGAAVDATNSLSPLDAKLASFGWDVREIDGHDYARLLTALQPSETGRPVAVIANTIKGKGVSFMEGRVEWHHKVPSPEQFQLALEELGGLNR